MKYLRASPCIIREIYRSAVHVELYEAYVMRLEQIGQFYTPYVVISSYWGRQTEYYLPILDKVDFNRLFAVCMEWKNVPESGRRQFPRLAGDIESHMFFFGISCDFSQYSSSIFFAIHSLGSCFLLFHNIVVYKFICSKANKINGLFQM